MSQNNPGDDSDVQAPPAQNEEAHGEPQATGGQVGQPVQTGPSVGEVLQRPAIQDRLKYVIAVYGVLGVGFGFLGIIAGEFIGGGGLGGVFFGATTLFVVLSIGPVLAFVFGLHLDEVLADAEDMALYATTAVGNAVGYLVMVFIAGILLSSGSGGGTNIGDILVAGIVLGIVVGAIAAALAFVQRSLA